MHCLMGFALQAGLAVLIATSGHSVPIRAQEPNRRELLQAVEERLKQTIQTAGPSVAAVVVSRSEHYPRVPGDEVPGRLGGFDRKEFLRSGEANLLRAQLAQSLDLSDIRTVADHSYAGGVVIDPSGLVLTPYHVIDGATKVYVYLPGGFGSYADIHAADARSDLAVLKLLTTPESLRAAHAVVGSTLGVMGDRLLPPLRAIRFADVVLRPGNGKPATVFPGKLCVLLANPYSSTFGFDRPSASFGSISNIRSRLSRPPGRAEDPASRYTEYGPLLEFDVRLNAGMSGGILLNLDGEMIGLTNATAVAWGSELGPGYAVPTDSHFLRIVDVLKRGGEVEYGFLGVVKDRIRPGIVIERTTPFGPAEQAGIQAGDEIVMIDGVPVETFDDLLLHVGSSLAGSKVRVSVSRLGRIRDFEVTLAKYRNEQPFIASARPKPVFGLRVDYTSILAQQQPLVVPPGAAAVRIPPGVWVREVLPDTPAAARFKGLGDTPSRWVITHVDDTPVSTPAEFYKAARGREKLKLSLIDPGEGTARPREIILP